LAAKTLVLFVSTNFAGMRLEILGNDYDYDNNEGDNKFDEN
jgi:hypothetical protein